jgi:hypothetical protein
MAGAQFLTPQPVSASRPAKKFTLQQANKALPLVKRIVADIVRTHEEITECQAQLELAKAAQQTRLQDRLRICLEHLQDYVDELTEVGCDLKDYRLGLVDFIGSHEGHDVCLCWKLGEETIGYWHEVNAGYTGRQPVSVLRENV